MSKNPVEQISFGIGNIRTKSFFINESEEIKPENVKFTIGTLLTGNKENKEVIIEINAVFFQNNDTSTRFLEITSNISYRVTNFDEVVELGENTIGMPEPFTVTLVSIAISTTRGLLASRTEGTKLKDFYIPILDPKNILANGIVANNP